MLKSYEAIYSHGQLHWLNQAPPDESGEKRVLVILDVSESITEQAIAGKSDIHKLLQQTRGIMGKNKTCDELDDELRDLRSGWDKTWGQ